MNVRVLDYSPFLPHLPLGPLEPLPLQSVAPLPSVLMLLVLVLILVLKLANTLSPRMTFSLALSLSLFRSLSFALSLSHTHAHIPTSELQYNEEDEEQGVESHDSELKVSLFLPRFLSLTLSASCIACTHALYTDTPSLSCSGVQHIHVQTHIRTQHTHT